MIYFRVKTTDIYNQYYRYSRIFEDISSMIEVVDFTVSYKPVADYISLCHYLYWLCIRINQLYLINIQLLIKYYLLNTEERVYLSLPHLFLEWFKIKWPKHPWASINPKELFIQDIKSIKGTKPDGGKRY